jgi:hypothetical protein
MLSKKLLVVLGLSLGGLSIAGTMGPVCTPGSLSVPCAMKQWDIGVRALYLRPSYSHPHTTMVIPNIPIPEEDTLLPATSAINVENLHEDNQRWGWAYQLEGSYHFNMNNDITLDWMHFAPPAGHLQFDGNKNNRFDRANLVLGQYMDIGPFKNSRIYTGLQYAKLNLGQVQTISYGPVFATYPNHSDFNGIGPAFGLDFAYTIVSGLSFTANTSTSVLYGTSRHIMNTSENNTVVIANTYSTRKQLVPGIEEKLGLNYNYQYAQGLLTINGGYQALNYFNMVNRIPGTGVISSDFGLFGPYFGVHWLSAS